MLKEDEDYGDQVLINSKPFAYINVSFSENSTPFLLAQAEYKMVMRISTVMPQVLLGREKASIKVLNNYQDMISAVINNSDDLPQFLRTKTTAKLLAINDAVLEQQIRNYGERFTADLSFAKHFIPSPYLYLPESRIGQQRQCFNRPLFCVKFKITNLSENLVEENIPSENIAIINYRDSQQNDSPAYEVITKHKLDELKQDKDARLDERYITSLSYWTQEFGAVCTAIFFIALLSLISYLQALRKIKKHYMKWPILTGSSN